MKNIIQKIDGAKSEKFRRVWKVGDKYRINDGKIITGKITKIDEAGYHISWSDGDETIEDYLSPMSK